MKRLIFVDDEPRVLSALQRQLHGLQQEWDMQFFESGRKALDFLEHEAVDVIVSDMMMPVMDGAELLDHVMKSHPQAVRLVLSGHSDREAVLRLVGPAHQYLAKPCNAEDLRSAINRAMAVRDLLASDSLKILTSQMKALPTLPEMQHQLTKELIKEEPSMERISEIISQDMGMTAKILQLVNSAFFGLPEPAATLHEASLFLGLTTIRALVLSLQIFSEFNNELIHDFSPGSLSQHCHATAVLAQRIAKMQRTDQKLTQQCFLAGLLHDVGQLLLASKLPERYGKVLRASRDSGKSLTELEEAEFGATHAQVGAYLLGLWGFPNPVVEAVAFHHHPGQCSNGGFSPALAVHAADIIARQNAGTTVAEDEIDPAVLAVLNLNGGIEELKLTG